MNRASDESAERMDGADSSRRSPAHEQSQQRVRTSDPITKVVSKVAKVRPSLAADAEPARPSHVERRRRHQISTRPDLPAARKRAWSCLEYQPGKANDNGSGSPDMDGSTAWEPEPFASLASLGPPPLPGASAAPSSPPVARESVRPARESTAPALREAPPYAAPKRSSTAPSARPSVPAPRPSSPPAGTAAERRPALVPPSPKAAVRQPFAKVGSAHPAAVHSSPTVVAMPSVRPVRVSTQRPVRRAAPPALLDYGSDVSQVVLSESGRLLNSTNGADDELLAETVGFTHRLATLTARALGFSGCPAMYLRSATSAIIVTEREAALVSGVSGKIDGLSEALARVGLE